MKLRIAIDMGSCSTKIYVLGNGVVLCEPSVVAVRNEKGQIVIKAIGLAAKKMLGKTAENISVIFPVESGEIVDEIMAVEMLKYFTSKITADGHAKIHATFTTVCNLSAEERGKFYRVGAAAGISVIDFAESAMCLSLGLHIPLSEFSPCFIADIGGGVTNIAALNLLGIMSGVSVCIGGNNIDDYLVDFIDKNFNLKIGRLSAEKLKLDIGSLVENDISSFVLSGRDSNSGKPKNLPVTAKALYPAVSHYYQLISDIIKDILSKLEPETTGEIIKSGIYIAGGSGLLYGVCEFLESRLFVPVHLTEDPQLAVILGAGVLIGSPELCKSLTFGV